MNYSVQWKQSAARERDRNDVRSTISILAESLFGRGWPRESIRILMTLRRFVVQKRNGIATFETLATDLKLHPFEELLACGVVHSIAKRGVFVDGELLTKLYTRRGWSQQEFASHAGLDARTIAKIKRGGSCDARTLQVLSATLKVLPESLLAEKDIPVPGKAETGNAFEHSAVLRRFRLLQHWKVIDLRNQQSLNSMDHQNTQGNWRPGRDAMVWNSYRIAKLDEEREPYLFPFLTWGDGIDCEVAPAAGLLSFSLADLRKNISKYEAGVTIASLPGYELYAEWQSSNNTSLIGTMVVKERWRPESKELTQTKIRLIPSDAPIPIKVRRRVDPSSFTAVHTFQFIGNPTDLLDSIGDAKIELQTKGTIATQAWSLEDDQPIEIDLREANEFLPPPIILPQR